MYAYVGLFRGIRVRGTLNPKPLTLFNLLRGTSIQGFGASGPLFTVGGLGFRETSLGLGFGVWGLGFGV